MPSRTSAQATAEASLCAQAKRTVLDLVKLRARTYIHRPDELESLQPGLSNATPSSIIAIAKQMIAAERHTRRRWFALGGEIPLLNAKALLLCGRALRRAANSRARLGRRPHDSNGSASATLGRDRSRGCHVDGP